MTQKKTVTKRGKVRKTSSLGQEILEGLKEAIAYERGEVLNVRTKKLPITARHAEALAAVVYTPADIKRLRKGVELSQAVFAQALNLDIETVKAWEQGKRTPSGPALRLLEVVERYPEVILAYVQPR